MVAAVVLALAGCGADETPPAAGTGAQQIGFGSIHNVQLYAMRADGRCVTQLTIASSWSVDPAPTTARAPCGTARPPAHSDVDLGPARAFTEHALFWLGPRHRGRLLSHAMSDANTFHFIYDHCARRRARDCGRTVQIESQALCTLPTAELIRTGTERGVAVFRLHDVPGGGGPAVLRTGDAEVTVQAVSRSAQRRALAALRPFEGAAGRPLAPRARRCA
jgi:hypothetical protein